MYVVSVQVIYTSDCQSPEIKPFSLIIHGRNHLRTFRKGEGQLSILYAKQMTNWLQIATTVMTTNDSRRPSKSAKERPIH